MENSRVIRRRYGHEGIRRSQSKESGRPGLIGLARKVFWAWWFWVVIAALAGWYGHTNAGFAFAGVALFTYLVASPERAPAYGLNAEFPVSSPEFVESIAGATGAMFTAGNKITVLNNGDEFYPSMLDAIKRAKQTITMEAYIYWAGEIGLHFARAMAERSRAGVTVKALLDAVGSSTIGKEILGILEESGCEVAWYHPLFRSTTIGRYNHRTHRKSLIVDGRVGFTGGPGIADHWTGDAQDPQHWRDIHVRIEGPAAVGLQTGFVQNWLSTTGELLSGSEYFPPTESSGKLHVQTILSSPEAGSSAVRIMYYMAIACARDRIYIANPYFIPDEMAVKILKEARGRGVDVKIMVAGEHNDMKTSRYASIQLYGKLLEAGIEVYEYRPTMMHQKTMVVDGIWSTIGTTNFDSRSFSLNDESNISVYDTALAANLEKMFDRDLKVSDRITLDQWRRRGVKTRLLGAVSLIFKDQI